MAELGAARRQPSVAQPVLAFYALAGGAISFLGWYADVRRLTDWNNAGISIQPNAAIAVVCAAFALLALRFEFRVVAGLLGGIVALIGATVLFEHATGIDLGIDGLFLFGRTWGRAGVIAPGRMGPPGATSWTLLGIGLLLLSFPAGRQRALAPALAVVAMIVAFLSLVGYLYGVTAFYTLPTMTVIALQTSTFVLAVSLGLLLSVPERAPMRLLDPASPAGALARRILPAVIIVPIILGLFRLRGEQAGLYDLAFDAAARTIVEIALMSALLWWAVSTIGRQARARQEAEEQLVESLREADRRKNVFLATLAHELRNPLAPLRNAATVIKLRTRQDPVLAKASEVVDRQVALMARLLDDLLDVGRITSDKLELRKEFVDLATIVHEAVEMSRPLVDQHRHELSVEEPPLAIYVDADPARLGQVFGNLVNNACKYTEPNGRIRIAIERHHSDAVVSVTDNGIGIPDDKRTSIFEMFSQVDRVLDRPHGVGLGIGLHLVKRLVEMHGGTIEVHSDGPGRGSRFTVRLPALPEAASAIEIRRAAPSVPTASTPARKILVVDDNIDHAVSLANVLSLDGHDTHTVHDGLEGLLAADRLRPDVALLDLGLPRINGFDVCRRIREQEWGKRMLVIAISGWGQDVDRRRSSEAGFDHHLVKPVDARLISALVTSEPTRPDSSVGTAI